MWPLYLLLNKILGAEEEKDHGSHEPHLNVVDAYTFSPLSISQDKDKSVLPRSHSVEVPLVNQQHTWDCGLACILMVLKNLGITDCDLQDLLDLCCTTSIWTVDLAYLLQKYCVSFSYFTVTFGANPNFSREEFYKEQLPHDLVRVDTLFQKAVDAGIDIQFVVCHTDLASLASRHRKISNLVTQTQVYVLQTLWGQVNEPDVFQQCRSVSEEEISILILSGNWIAIALINLYELSNSWLEDVCISGLYSGSSDYAGHYVVICGYDAETNEFEIRDPASSRKHEKVTLKRLQEARKSFGTDEDLLLISLV